MDGARTDGSSVGGGVPARGRGATWSDVAPPPWLLRWGLAAACLLLLAGAVWLFAELVSTLTLLAVPTLVALLLAGVVQPAVDAAGRRGVPRKVSAGVVVALVLVVTVAVIALVASRVSEQVGALGDQLSEARSQLGSVLGVDLSGQASGGSSDGGSGQGQGSGSGSGEGSSSGSGSASSLVGVLTSSLGLVADLGVGLFLTLIFLFLFISDGDRMWGWFLSKLGGRRRDEVAAAGGAAWSTVGAYVRGLTIVAAFDAVGIGIGLYLLGVPLAVTLALLQFLASYVPTFGSIVAGAVAVLVAWVSQGVGVAVAVLVLAIVVQQIGNDVIEPYVMQRRLPINAFVVLAAVTAGGVLWGVAGALLFVPLAAAISAGTRELWDRRGRPVLGVG